MIIILFSSKKIILDSLFTCIQVDGQKQDICSNFNYNSNECKYWLNIVQQVSNDRGFYYRLEHFKTFWGHAHLVTQAYKEQHLFRSKCTTHHISDIYKESGAGVKWKESRFI